MLHNKIKKHNNILNNIITKIKKLENENYKLNLAINKFRQLDKKFYLTETKLKEILKNDNNNYQLGIPILAVLEFKLNRIQFEYKKLENEYGNVGIYQLKKLITLNNKKISQLYSKLKNDF